MTVCRRARHVLRRQALPAGDFSEVMVKAGLVQGEEAFITVGDWRPHPVATPAIHIFPGHPGDNVTMSGSGANAIFWIFYR
eukprot:SAG11_NODE_3810_length_2212_cov_1.791765_1_plen_81_part_00